MKYCDKCHSTYPTEFTVCPKDQTALRETSELPDGSVLRGKYQVICKIGAGGMATVYKANHLTFNEVRALKVVSSSLLNDKEFIARFKNEAVITRKLKHPNAVRVDDFDLTDDGRPYIVMEYVEGKSLRDVMHHDGPFTPARALAITRQVAAALAAAHKLGIVHRDIKPDNIHIETLSNGTELIKVLDFGIAKLREGAGGSGSGGYTPTQTGMVMGTPQYISPEQAMGQSGDQIDGRADLYSLGIVLYEMLTGEVPFKAETPVALLIHHINTVPTPPHTLKPELKIPQPLSQLLMKALEKDRDNRFQSADEMLAALDRPQKWAELAAPPSSARKGKAAFATGDEDDYTTVPRDRDEGSDFPTESTRGGLFDEDRARKSSYEDWLTEEETKETKLEPKPVAPVPVTPGPTPATAVATPPGMVPVGAAGAAAKPAKTITPVGGSGPPSVKIGIKQVAPVPVSVPAPPPRRVVTPVPAQPDRRILFIGGGAALVLLLIIGGYFLFRPHPQPPAAPTTATAPTTPGVPAPGTEDARIYDGVKEMLSQATSDSLRAQPPLVAVDKGVVTLSGRVASREDQMLAYQLAGTVDGVNQVNNEMKIGAPLPGGNRTSYPTGTQTTLTPRNNNTQIQNPNVILSPEEAGSVSLGDAARQRARQLPSTQQQIEQHLRQGHAAMQSQDYDGAIAQFQQVLQLDPTNPAATLGLRRAQRLKNGR